MCPVFVVFYDLIKKAIYWALGKRGQEELIERYEDTYHPPAQEVKKRPAFLRGQRRQKENVKCCTGRGKIDMNNCTIPEKYRPLLGLYVPGGLP